MTERESSSPDDIDVILGVTTGCRWAEVEAWALSLARCGFSGLGIAIVYIQDGEDDAEIVGNLRSLGVRVLRLPMRENLADRRFADIAKVLRASPVELRYAVITDVREVYFQADPTRWLEQHLSGSLVAVGGELRPLAGARPLAEVGVIAGLADTVAQLCEAITDLVGDARTSVSQAVYNLLLGTEPYREWTQFATADEAFVCQGDSVDRRSRRLPGRTLGPEPVLDSNGVRTADGRLYPIVQRYELVPEWYRELWLRLPLLPADAGRAYSIPAEMTPASAGSAPLVSVICPTYRRPEFLRKIVECYCSQTFDRGMEFLIFDDSPERSDFLDDDRYAAYGIRYHHLPGRRTIGEKLNILTQLARGEIIVEFDDDDFYTPQYVARMVELLGDADLVTLSGWFAFDPRDRNLFYWATDVLAPAHFVLSSDQPLESVSTDGWNRAVTFGFLWGYGFSYVWRKSVFPTVQIRGRPPDRLEWEWDFDFAQRVRRAGFEVTFSPDTEGLVLHLIHARSTVRMFPQYLLPESALGEIFPEYLELPADHPRQSATGS